MQDYYPSTSEVEAGRSGIQNYLPLHNKCEDSLGYMGPCLTINVKEKVCLKVYIAKNNNKVLVCVRNEGNYLLTLPQ